MRGRPDRYTDGSDPLGDKGAGRRFSITGPGLAILVVVIIVVGLVVLLSRLTGPDAEGPTQAVAKPGAGASSVPSTPQERSTEPTVDETGSEEPPERVARQATRTAEQFTEAWMLRGSTAERRQALTAVATPHLTESLLLVPSPQLSTGRVVGKPDPVAFSDVYAKFNVSLDTGEVIAVSVAQQPDGSWLAVDVLPVQEPREEPPRAEESETPQADQDSAATSRNDKKS